MGRLVTTQSVPLSDGILYYTTNPQKWDHGCQSSERFASAGNVRAGQKEKNGNWRAHGRIQQENCLGISRRPVHLNPGRTATGTTTDTCGSTSTDGNTEGTRPKPNANNGRANKREYGEKRGAMWTAATIKRETVLVGRICSRRMA